MTSSQNSLAFLMLKAYATKFMRCSENFIINFVKKLNLSKLCPIQVHELSRFLPLFFIKFLASFTYTILNATKDTVIVTTKGSGAEVIPILKGGVVICIAFLFMLAYSKLSNKLNRENLFYVVLTPFLLFFLIYGCYLYPNQDHLSFHNSANYLAAIIGESHQHWIAVYRYWMNSIFFVVAEMWGGVMIGLLFWGFANQISTVKDAAKFYALYSAGGHLGTILAGNIIINSSNSLVNDFSGIVHNLMLIAFIAGILIICIYWWTNRYILENIINNAKPINKKEKTKLSLTQSLIFISKSPYLGLIALLVIGYGISVNMVEVVWKAVLKIQYPESAKYQEFMGGLQMSIGTVSLFVAIFLGSTVIRKFGWRIGALFTPIVLSITSIMFFSIYFLYPDFATHNNNINLFGFTITPLLLLVICGAVHNVSCKSMKYCLFDPTKEMAYIPLDEESKVKGKAAVDLVGGRFGKSSASWIQLGLIDFVGAGSILGVVQYLVPIIFIVVVAWIASVKLLGKKFDIIQQNSSKQISKNHSINNKEKSSGINKSILAIKY